MKISSVCIYIISLFHLLHSENINLTFDDFLTNFDLDFTGKQYDYREQLFKANITQLVTKGKQCLSCGVTKFFVYTAKQIENLKGTRLPQYIIKKMIYQKDQFQVKRESQNKDEENETNKGKTKHKHHKKTPDEVEDMMSPKTDQEKAKAVSVKTTTSKKNPTILKAPSESISSTTQTQKTQSLAKTILATYPIPTRKKEKPGKAKTETSQTNPSLPTQEVDEIIIGSPSQSNMKKIAEALNSISEYSLDQPNTLNIVSADPLQKFQPIAQETAINTLPTVSTTPDTNDPKNIVIEPIESGYSKEKDWRKKSMVTKVKDQGNCGSSATFATIALCESVLMLTGKAFTKAVYQVDLSEQYLLYCTVGNNCDEGEIENALDRALSTGVPLDVDYPYEPLAKPEKICFSKTNVRISTNNRKSLYNVHDSEIIKLLQKGPVIAAVSADGWQYYTGGIFSCSKNSVINHAVLVVGYNETVWIAKNSWGTNFGQEGYIYITRNRKHHANCWMGTSIHLIWGCQLKVHFLALCFLLFLLWQ